MNLELHIIGTKGKIITIIRNIELQIHKVKPSILKYIIRKLELFFYPNKNENILIQFWSIFLLEYKFVVR